MMFAAFVAPLTSGRVNIAVLQSEALKVEVKQSRFCSTSLLPRTLLPPQIMSNHAKLLSWLLLLLTTLIFQFSTADPLHAKAMTQHSFRRTISSQPPEMRYGTTGPLVGGSTGEVSELGTAGCVYEQDDPDSDRRPGVHGGNEAG
ncbi:hypothetical protein QJS10_CPA10g00437 [Acorus calamus]|uniref:Uncharacterized protein n=1 Tax=Acorus calamus TaxID=4465 RepID=A0AAV9DZ69_ACOCL|nr:hypothetical protein QJS10_CPA10g00437 [Acorus calamus]